MSIAQLRVPLYVLPAWLVLCWAGNAETMTVSGPRPLENAAIKLEDVYGWAITYEEVPLVYAGDLRDVTSQSRKDKKSAGEPGVQQILAPRLGTFSFSFDPPSQREPGTRAPEGLTRAAILDMLKSYALSIGGVEAFTLTDSSEIFHIIPTQRKGLSGAWEKVAPLLDTKVIVPPGQRTGEQLVNEICRSLSSQAGVLVGLAAPSYINMLATRRTQIASKPDETARSILSRFFAELTTPPPGLPERAFLRRPVSWHLSYLPGYGYGLSMRVVDASPKR